MDMFDSIFVNVPCPKCDYGFDVELLSVRMESLVFCPCCKSSIQLVDSEASVHGAEEDVNSALKGLEEELKKLGGTFKFEL